MWSEGVEGVEGVEGIKDIEGVEHGYLFQESRMTLAKAFWTLVARLLGRSKRGVLEGFCDPRFPLNPGPLFADIHRSWR
jgi:hypothetical protein